MDRKIAAILFLDVAGYSKMTEPQLRTYMQRILPELAKTIEPHRSQMLELNTWGDAIVGISPDPYRTAHLALDLRDFFRNRNWSDDGLPGGLGCRIALHSAVIFTGKDPIRGFEGVVGTQVNLAARIEPVTTPGEVWVSEQFVKLIDAKTDTTLAFDDLGERPLAKKFGSMRLHRLRRHHECAPPPSDIQVESVSGPVRSRELEITIHMARHGNEHQRKIALDMLGNLQNQDSIATLLEVARDKGAPHLLRRMALASLDELKPKAAVPDLIAIVDDSEELPDITGAAIEVLGAIRDVRAIPCLKVALLGNRVLEVDAVKAGILALAKIGDPSAIPIFKEMLEHIDRFKPALPEVLVATGVLPDPCFVKPVQAIAEGREDYHTELRGLAISALILNSPNQSEELFIRLAQDESELHDVRHAAVGALAAVPTVRAKAVLHELASDLLNPLCERAVVVMTKGASLLEEQRHKLKAVIKGG